MRAVLLVSHGSRSAETKNEIIDLVERLRKRRVADIVEFAFLELENPNIPDGIAHCVQQGATHLIVLLNFLNSGRHVDIDIPVLISKARDKYPSVEISVTRTVGQHPGMADLFIDLISS